MPRSVRAAKPISPIKAEKLALLSFSINRKEFNSVVERLVAQQCLK
jgi:hypothetical protein